MKQKIRKIKRSLAAKLTWRIMLTFFLAILLTTFFVSTWSFLYITMEEGARYDVTRQLVNEKLNNMFNAIEIAGINNQQLIEKDLDEPERLKAIVEDMLRRNPQIQGCAVAFSPAYFPNKGRWYELYGLRVEGDSVVMKEIGSESHDYLQASWYHTAIASDSAMWSEPYFDDTGANSLICTYSIPIHDKRGKPVAVMGIDIGLKWLDNQQRTFYKDSRDMFDLNDDDSLTYLFIIDRDGRYLVHPDSTRLMKPMTDYIDTLNTYNDLAASMMAGENDMRALILDDKPSVVLYAPLERTRWSAAFVISVSYWLGKGSSLAILFAVVMFIALLLTSLVCFFYIRQMTKPLRKFSQSADEIAKGNFQTRLPFINTRDEVGVLHDSFREMQLSLADYMSELEKTTAQKASIESELKIASDIQRQMLPKTFPPYPERHDIDIYGMLTPAKAVGGDLYDFFLRDDRLYFCIGDVSGKGVPAAMVMAVAKVLFRTVSVHNESPAGIVTTINHALLSNDNDTNMFVTFFVGILDVKTGVLQYCNAGHDAPLLVSSQGVSLLPVDSNIPLGVMNDWEYVTQQVTIDRDVMTFLYTDGLTEAEDVSHNQFGEERITETAVAVQTADAQSFDAQSFVDSMTEAVHAFVGEAEQSDDLTMLAIKLN